MCHRGLTKELGEEPEKEAKMLWRLSSLASQGKKKVEGVEELGQGETWGCYLLAVHILQERVVGWRSSSHAHWLSRCTREFVKRMKMNRLKPNRPIVFLAPQARRANPPGGRGHNGRVKMGHEKVGMMR